MATTKKKRGRPKKVDAYRKKRDLPKNLSYVYKKFKSGEVTVPDYDDHGGKFVLWGPQYIHKDIELIRTLKRKIPVELRDCIYAVIHIFATKYRQEFIDLYNDLCSSSDICFDGKDVDVEDEEGEKEENEEETE